ARRSARRGVAGATVRARAPTAGDARDDRARSEAGAPGRPGASADSLYYPLPMAPDIVNAVRAFVDGEVRPAAPALQPADAYPHALVARMRALGLFGALVPPEYGGLGCDVTTYARIIEELCRGWMSLAGVVNSHTMAALIVLHHGTEEQRRRFLPRFASG